MSNCLRKILTLAALSLLWGLALDPVAAQQWSLEPETPRWGETLRFEWTPEPPTTDAPSEMPLSEMPPTELPQVLVMATDEDGQARWLVSEIQWQEGRGLAELVVPDGLAYLQFFTTDSPKVRRLRGRRVERADGSPARGAWEQHLWNVDPSKVDSAVAEELAHHPDNFSVYRALWWLKSITERSTFPSDSVRQQIANLEQLDRRTDEWLYAMAIGKVLLGEREKGLALIHELAERFPTSPLVARAFGDYDYKLLELGLDSDQARDFREFRLAHLERHPDLPGAGEMLLGMSHSSGTRPIPIATAERAFGTWMQEQPGHPLPHLGLARVYRDHGQQLDRGLEETLRAIDLLLAGNLFRYGDLEGDLADFYMPIAYLEAAQLARDLGRRAEALAFTTLAQDLEVERTPQPYDLEGELWRSLARPDRAEAAYRTAWRLGSMQAEDELAQLFEAREGSRERFERYLRAVQEGAMESKGSGEPEPAPQFAVETLDGTPYDSDQLRGKVVVLNFWGTGCLPCRAEVPDLNQLVRRFEDRDVVFLAPTQNSASGLDSFLEELPFAYEIVPEGRQLFADYQVSGIPVHVVIDKEGMVMLRRTGASENLADELAQIIERAL